jgi:hypothetical protein
MVPDNGGRTDLYSENAVGVPHRKLILKKFGLYYFPLLFII